MGFNPAIGTKAAEADPPRVSGTSGGGSVPKVRIGGFTTDAVGDGTEVSAGDVQTRVLNRCFGVSMLGR